MLLQYVVVAIWLTLIAVLCIFFVGNKNRKRSTVHREAETHNRAAVYTIPRHYDAPAPELQSRGADIDSLIKELIQIGKADKFLSRDRQGARVREIGTILDGRGGMGLMRSVHDEVNRVLGSEQARMLEVAWDNIGGWLA